MFLTLNVICLQGNPILGVHIYLHSDDVSMVDCLEGHGNMPGDPAQGAALCHTVTDADGIFTFKSVPCGNSSILNICHSFKI